MYWQPETRKFDPESAAIAYMPSSTDPGVPPNSRVRDNVAGGRLQVATPSCRRLNLIGMTPRFALNTLDPSELTGCCTCAIVNGKAMTKSLNVFVLPPVVGSVPTVPGFGLKKVVISKTNWLSSTLYGGLFNV